MLFKMQNKMAFSLSPFQNLFRYKGAYWNLVFFIILKSIANVKTNEKSSSHLIGKEPCSFYIISLNDVV